jgi:hypothetical protein
LCHVIICVTLDFLLFGRYLAEEIKKRDGFRLVMEPEYTNVCFWYIPPSLRDMADGPEFWRNVHAVSQRRTSPSLYRTRSSPFLWCSSTLTEALSSITQQQQNTNQFRN